MNALRTTIRTLFFLSAAAGLYSLLCLFDIFSVPAVGPWPVIVLVAGFGGGVAAFLLTIFFVPLFPDEAPRSSRTDTRETAESRDAQIMPRTPQRT